MQTYQMISEEYGFKGFFFHATNQEDATYKAQLWNHYHSFRPYPGCGWHIAVEITGECPPEEYFHDEYIPSHY